MSDDWLTNDEAVVHVKRLLKQMGAPLESRVARICANTNIWSHTITHVDHLSMSSGRLVYGNTAAETALREVDQGVSVQTFVDVGGEDEDFFDLSLDLQVAIECKHRDGLAVFGFPYQSRTNRSATNPILCEFAFADFIKSIDSKVPFLHHHDICTIGLLDAMQKSPRISDEQLIYKASASLYDFIRFSILAITEPTMDSTIQKMGLIEQFKEEVKEPIGDVWAEARAWIKSKFTDDIYKEFYIQRGTRGGNSVPAVALFVPLICVDAPLYSVDVGENGDIDSIKSRAFLLSAARLPRWPSIFHNYLARSTPEALITIVNVDYLEEFLERLAQWFSDIGDYLHTIDETVVRQALVQGAFLQSLMSVMGQPHQFDGLWRV